MNRNPYGDLLPSITQLMLLTNQAKKSFKARPQSEQDEINAKYEAQKDAKRVSNYIQQGLCPECAGKLIRGKKDKRNDYKRTWRCAKCERDIIH